MTARSLTLATLLTWPAGLLLVVANMEVDAVTPPVYVALAALYAAGVFSLLRTWTPTVTEPRQCWWRLRRDSSCRSASRDHPLPKSRG